MTIDAPSLFALIGVIVTAVVTLVLGIVKWKSDQENNESDSTSAFQDRLIKRLDAQDELIQRQNERINQLETTVDTLRGQNRLKSEENFVLEQRVRELEQERNRLELEVQRLRTELLGFEKLILRQREKDHGTTS